MFSSWRGIIGVVHPTLRPGSNEELIRMLPEGIGVLALHVNIKRGTPEEFVQMKAAFEKELDLLKEAGCDVIHPSGAPPFMVHGRDGEKKIIDEWEARYGIPMFTSGQNHVNALKRSARNRSSARPIFRKRPIPFSRNISRMPALT